MKIGIGISGGVDSAAAAYLLKQQGHDISCYTMLLCGDREKLLKKAEAVANKLDAKLNVLDFAEYFQKNIIRYFTDQYAIGMTPSPCVRCNRTVKFGVMLDAVLADGCDMMATGHYARLIQEGGTTYIERGSDRSKDQSYFLAQLSNQQKSKVIFPLGGYLKSDIKSLCTGLNLIEKSESESQDLCFIPNGDTSDFLLSAKPDLAHEGWIVDTSGKKLGRHNGFFRYTIGQRKGLGLGGGPWFVTGLDCQENLVIVSHGEDLRCSSVEISDMVWHTANSEPLDGAECMVQMRYLMKPVKAIIRYHSDNKAAIEFPDSAPAVPTGQLAVAYVNDRVLASGWITHVNRQNNMAL